MDLYYWFLVAAFGYIFLRSIEAIIKDILERRSIEK